MQTRLVLAQTVTCTIKINDLQIRVKHFEISNLSQTELCDYMFCKKVFLSVLNNLEYSAFWVAKADKNEFLLTIQVTKH